jgi:hypothetical protein
MSDSKVFMFPE